MNDGPRDRWPSPDDPAFWDEFYADDVRRPSGWPEASGKQRCVLFSADEQDSLSGMLARFLGDEVDGHVMVEVDQRSENGGDAEAGYALRPGKEWKPCSDAAAADAAVQEFATVVRDLIARGLVEIRQVWSEASYFDDAPPLPADRVDQILADPASWLDRGNAGRPVKIALAGRPRKRTVAGPDLDHAPG